MHRDCLLIEIYQLGALNCISVYTFVFIPTRFGAFCAPSSGTVSVFNSLSTHSHQWFVTPCFLQHSTYWSLFTC